MKTTNRKAQQMVTFSPTDQIHPFHQSDQLSFPPPSPFMQQLERNQNDIDLLLNSHTVTNSHSNPSTTSPNLASTVDMHANSPTPSSVETLPPHDI